MAKMIRKKFVGSYATVLAYDEATKETLTSVIFVQSKNPKAINKMCANFMKENYPELRFMGVLETSEAVDIREMPSDFFYQHSESVFEDAEPIVEDDSEIMEGTATAG